MKSEKFFQVIVFSFLVFGCINAIAKQDVLPERSLITIEAEDGCEERIHHFILKIEQVGKDAKVYYKLSGSSDNDIITKTEFSIEHFEEFWKQLMRLDPFQLKEQYHGEGSTGEYKGSVVIEYFLQGTRHYHSVRFGYLPKDPEFQAVFNHIFKMKDINEPKIVELNKMKNQGEKIHSSYDWQLHEELIDKQFEEYKPQVLQVEREKIESLLTKDKAEIYMKRFEEGMRSSTGFIMIEAVENHWLEIAYQSGYKCKELFRQGYFKGLIKAAESPEMRIPIREITKEEALAIAKKALGCTNITLDNYYVAQVKEIKRNNRDIWFVTFDLNEKQQYEKDKMPKTVGGEIFVDVDKETGETAIRW